MTVSIIIPIYNAVQYLPACLSSVIRQSYEDLEIICVDDGSTDDSARIAAEAADSDSRVTVLTQKNSGLSAARNVGLDKATGEFVFFIDSDDMIHQTAIEQLVAAAVRFKAQIVSTKLCSSSQFEDEISERKKLPEVKFRRVDLDEFYFQNSISNHACGKLFETSLFKDKGIQFPVGRAYEDVATMYLLMMQAEEIVCTDESLYYYRPNELGITHTYTTEKVNDYILAYKEIKTAFGLTISDSQRYYLLTVLYTILRLINNVPNIATKSSIQVDLEREYDHLFQITAIQFKKNPWFSAKLILRRFYAGKLLLKAKGC